MQSHPSWSDPASIQHCPASWNWIILWEKCENEHLATNQPTFSSARPWPMCAELNGALWMLRCVIIISMQSRQEKWKMRDMRGRPGMVIYLAATLRKEFIFTKQGHKIQKFDACFACLVPGAYPRISFAMASSHAAAWRPLTHTGSQVWKQAACFCFSLLH